MSKRAVNRLQNLALVVLSLVAAGLLSQIPLLNGDWTNQVQAFLTHSSDSAQQETVNLSSALSSVHIVITGDSEYGRYVQMYAPVDGTLFQQVGPLFQEALGSATEVGATADKTLQEALGTPGIYMDLTTELPLEIVAAWLNEETGYDRPVRAMVVGIPNVGKSTFINSFAGRACAKTGNKPGVTKGAQWIRLNKQVELLDTPGILWPKFDDPQVGVRLAMLGSVNDEILNLEELASELAVFVQQHFPGALKERYKSDFPADVPSWMILGKIAEARGCLSKGGEPDLNKAASFLLDDFRAGRLGRITLEFPPDGKGTEER